MTTRYKTIEDVYDALNNIPMFGNIGRSAAKFSLNAISDFCEQMGDPQKKFKSIHVAGTNGKGTTCRMLASVYQSAGYRTGLFTSPHLTDYRERITVDSEWIPEEDLLHFFQIHEQLIDEVKLSYFELATAIGFWYFEKKGVDIAIIETGLGGRLDATNILRPIATAITSVGLDHTDILGDTIGEIAREKAGIIKPNTPVVVGLIPEDAMNAIRQRAEQLNAPFIYPAPGNDGSDTSNYAQSFDRSLTLAARMNGQIVRNLIHCINHIVPVSSKQIADGFTLWTNRYPAGASFRRVHSDYPWYFDGAHNLDAFKLLKQQLLEISPLSSWTLVLSMMRDKLTSELVSELSEFSTVIYYPLKLSRAATENEVKELMPDCSILNAENSLPKMWVQKNKSELVIFGGSFYFYKTLMQWIDNIADH